MSVLKEDPENHRHIFHGLCMKYFPKKLIVWKLEIHAGITTKKCNHELVKYSFRTKPNNS